MAQIPDVGNADRAMRQELPSRPTDDIDGQPPRAQNTPICTATWPLNLDPQAARNGSARVISAGVRHSASHRRRRHLRDDLGPSADRPGLLDARAAGQGSILGSTGPSSQFRVRFVRSVIQLCRKPELLRPRRQRIEHAAGWAAASARLVLPLLHDFPDPGKSHRNSCSSPLGHINSPYLHLCGHGGWSPACRLPPAPGDRHSVLSYPSRSGLCSQS
jgi:hypothetical protein